MTLRTTSRPGSQERGVAHLIARNSIASLLFFAAQLMSGLIAVPLALRALGQDRFGLVSLATGLALLFQFANLGLAVGLARFVGAYAVSRDRLELQRYVSDAYLVALLGNGVVGVGMVCLGIFGTGVLHISGADAAAFTAISIIIGISSILNGVLTIPRAILAGLQLTGLRTKCDLITALGPLVGAIAVTVIAPSVTLYVVVLQGCALIGGLLVLAATRQVMPWVKHRPGRSKGTFGRFFRFSGLQILNQIGDIIFLTSDRLVLQTTLGVASVANYTIVERLQKLTDGVVSIPLTAVLPASAQAWSSDDRHLVERLVHSGTRLYLASTLPVIAVLIGLMKPFLTLWVGAPYAHLSLAAQMFVLSLAAPAFVRVFSNVLLGKGRQKETVASKLAFAPVNLITSIVLARRIGVLGVVLPTTAYYVLVFPTVQMALMRVEGFSVFWFLRDVAPLLLAGSTLVVLCLTAASRLLIADWLSLAGLASVATALGYGVFFLLLKPSERMVIRDLARRSRPESRPPAVTGQSLVR